ncbi:MAG TPA: hypothetical protein VJZ69_04275 [Clostridia bacterium]|nr:hypothetical protein [Clostridia bacterium]
MDNNSIKPIKLAVIIVDRGEGKHITKLLGEVDVSYHLITLGQGTAPTELQTYFGFGETEKDIIWAFISSEKLSATRDALTKKLCIGKPNSGIAFTIPINSISGLKELKYFLGGAED